MQLLFWKCFRATLPFLVLFTILGTIWCPSNLANIYQRSIYRTVLQPWIYSPTIFSLAVSAITYAMACVCALSSKSASALLVFPSRPPPQNSPRQKRRNTHIHHPQPLDPQNPEIDIHTRVRIVGVSHGDSGAGMPHTRRRAADIFLYTYRCQQAHSTAASP